MSVAERPVRTDFSNDQASDEFAWLHGTMLAGQLRTRGGPSLVCRSDKSSRARTCLRVMMSAESDPDHKSALCVVAPRSAIAPIQELRCFKDKNFVRWPPHINLLYPFLPDAKDSFAGAAQTVAQALRTTPPFKVLPDVGTASTLSQDVNLLSISTGCGPTPKCPADHAEQLWCVPPQ